MALYEPNNHRYTMRRVRLARKRALLNRQLRKLQAFPE